MSSTETKTKWLVDPTHSEVQFKVKHLVISTVTGNFNSFNAEVETDGEEFEHASISFTADINSIDTNNADRDNHLKSADFFDAEKFPTLSFKSTAFTKKNGTNYTLTGDLTIKETTRTIVLDVDFGGTMKDPYGQFKAGFEITGRINRKEFGLTWSAVTEAGGVVVADEIKLIMNIQLVKQ
ncbi:MAG: YceI family protein [Luteibaculaceae bacterium]